MARRRWIQLDGKLYEVGVDVMPETGPTGPAVFGDLPDVVSPIDGTVIKGRKGMRDHCQRHNVVLTADLAGLPPKPSVQEYVPDRAAIRDELRRAINK